MRILPRLISLFVINLIGLLAAYYLVPGFTISLEPVELGMLVVFLTLTNVLIRPIIKLVLSPLIVLTLGLFTIVINAAILWALDFFLTSITIEGLLPLVYATVLMSVINLLLHTFSRNS